MKLSADHAFLDLEVLTRGDHDGHTKLEALRARYGPPAARTWTTRISARPRRCNSATATGAGCPFRIRQRPCSTPFRPDATTKADFGGIDVALIVGVPMDLGVTNRAGARPAPPRRCAGRAHRPYEHVLRMTPMADVPASPTSATSRSAAASAWRNATPTSRPSSPRSDGGRYPAGRRRRPFDQPRDPGRGRPRPAGRHDPHRCPLRIPGGSLKAPSSTSGQSNSVTLHKFLPLSRSGPAPLD